MTFYFLDSICIIWRKAQSKKLTILWTKATVQKDLLLKNTQFQIFSDFDWGKSFFFNHATPNF